MQTYKGEKSISYIINNTTKKLFKKKGFNIFKLIEQWQYIIDKNYVPYTMPIAINNTGLYKKTLEIEVNNSGIIFDLQYGKDTLIVDINNFFQQEVVTDLKFKLLETQELNIKNEPNKITINTAKKDLNPKLKSEINLITDETMKEKLMKIAQKFA